MPAKNEFLSALLMFWTKTSALDVKAIDAMVLEQLQGIKVILHKVLVMDKAIFK